MSFILDALRKSESERQQEARPSIARIPSALPQHGLPAWAVATMALLGLGVVVLAGAWVKTMTEPPRSAAIGPDEQALGPGTDGGQAAEPIETDAGGAASRRDAAAYATEAAPGGSGEDQRLVEPLSLPPPRTAADRSPLAQVAQPPPLAMAARTQSNARNGSQPNAAPRSAGEPLPAVVGIPDPYESAASSLGLPPLTLELLAYGDNPAEQFVFINGARYAAGDRLPDGARVIEINRRGAVLLVNGRQLQLEAR